MTSTMQRIVTMNPGEQPLPLDAARLRHRRIERAVTDAAAVLAPVTPLDRFVAQNPLAGLETLPFHHAREALAEHRGGADRELDVLRRRLAEQPDAHRWLERVIGRRLGVLVADRTIELGGQHVKVSEVIAIDALHGPIADGRPTPLLPSELLDARRPGTGTRVDRYCATWAAAFLDESATWPMPRRDLGLFASWRRLAVRDPSLRELAGRGAVELVERSPRSALDALGDALVRCDVDPVGTAMVVRRGLCRVAGWSAVIADRHRHELAGWVAMRMLVEAALIEPGGTRREVRAARRELLGAASAPGADAELGTRVDAVLDELHLAPLGVPAPARARVADALSLLPDRLAILADALDERARSALMASIGELATSDAPSKAGRASVQVICCIDPRSEGLRRHIEATASADGDPGLVATFGAAGFFGLAVELQGVDESSAAASCPIPVAPIGRAHEQPRDLAAMQRRQDRRRAHRGLMDAWKHAKSHSASAFSLAEAAGWAAGPCAVGQTFAPALTERITAGLHRWFHPEVPTTWRWDDDWDASGAVAGLLRSIGLVRDFAPVVVLVGHRSAHRNNAHRSALDCGACGGRGGEDNARLAAAVLNRPEVRRRLIREGIAVPADTWFVAAEHETTTDRVELLDTSSVPASHRAAVTEVARLLDEAGGQLCLERAPSLPGAIGMGSPQRMAEVRSRRSDWAQVVPEWGLAGNHAFVVGPRSLTRSVDLGRRVFLHSYDPHADPNGDVLAGILSGPAVVAHGINAQYRATAIDPDHAGAGPKPLHNPAGRWGVLRGPDGDLQLGLPAESVGRAGTQRHEPTRLSVVVAAPPERLDAVLRTTPPAARLVDGGWMHLVALDPDRGWCLRRDNGDWVAHSGAGTSTHVSSSAISVS